MNEPKPFEIGTAAEFERKYPGYAKRAFEALPAIDREVVPENLMHLVSFAEEWGIPDSFLRHQYCQEAPPEKVASLKAVLAGTHALYEEWCYTEPDAPLDDSSEKKVKYAHWRFTSMYLAEMESFDGRGLRGFWNWLKEYDPDAYKKAFHS
jgi:hypothetical protein